MLETITTLAVLTFDITSHSRLDNMILLLQNLGIYYHIYIIFHLYTIKS